MLGKTAAGEEVARADLEALAGAVLNGDERVRLALEVRAGGPFAVRRAIELAALVLASAREGEAADVRSDDR